MTAALGLFKDGRSQGLLTDVIAYNAIISTWVKDRQWQRATRVFERCARMGLSSQGPQAEVILYGLDSRS